MESIMVQDHHQSFSSPYYKQSRNPKNSSRAFVYNPSENMQRGLLFSPPPPLLPRSYSYHHHQQQQPLLPLPIPRPQYNSLPARNRDRKPSRAREQSLTPKKAKKPTKREEPKQDLVKPTEKTIEIQQDGDGKRFSFIVSSVNRLGPDPNDLPKDVSKVLSAGIVAVQEFEKFSGSVFTLSPPPSSLPLPKFSVRPKLMSCNAEAAAAAAGIDAGATDNLRRLLRL